MAVGEKSRRGLAELQRAGSRGILSLQSTDIFVAFRSLRLAGAAKPGDTRSLLSDDHMLRNHQTTAKATLEVFFLSAKIPSKGKCVRVRR